MPPLKLSDAELPHVLVQIPAFNEGKIAADALFAAATLSWPKDKLHIQLLDDSTDETSELAEAATRQLRVQGFDVAHVRRDDRDGFKGGARWRMG